MSSKLSTVSQLMMPSAFVSIRYPPISCCFHAVSLHISDKARNTRAIDTLNKHATLEAEGRVRPELKEAFDSFAKILKQNPRAHAIDGGTPLCKACDHFWETLKSGS